MSNSYKEYTSKEYVDSKFLALTIPRGRIKGDLNYDGVITEEDAVILANGPTSVDSIPKYYGINVSSLFPDGNLPEDFIAADVVTDSSYDLQDTQRLLSIPIAVNKKYGQLGDILGNWVVNPNYETETYQFYYDVANENLTSNKDVVVSVTNILSDLDIKLDLTEGSLKIYVDKLPLEDSQAMVWMLPGSGNVSLMRDAAPNVDRIKDGSQTSTTLSQWLKNTPYYLTSFELEINGGSSSDFQLHVKQFLCESCTRSIINVGYGVGTVGSDEYYFRLRNTNSIYYVDFLDDDSTYECYGEPYDIKILDGWVDQDGNKVIAPLNTTIRAFGEKGQGLGFVDDCMIGPIDVASKEYVDGKIPAVATPESNGLMSSTDKAKIDTVPASMEDTTYTAARYRASAIVATETDPTVNGVINWTYE